MAAVAVTDDGYPTTSYIYRSWDGGASWTMGYSSKNFGWSSVACSADGTKLVAVSNSGPLFTSSGPVPGM
jgi:photosystem II stability/assembly factor-like uncharacterized protein